MAKGWTFQLLINGKMTVTAHCHHAPCNQAPWYAEGEGPPASGANRSRRP
jgi:hypothetical protein